MVAEPTDASRAHAAMVDAVLGGSPPADARTLERAAQIIAERSTKPDSVATRALVKVLRKQAEVIRREAAGGSHP